MSVSPRLNRLLGADGKCFDVAIDHGIFNEASFLGGIEDMAAAVRTLAAAKPDAIQLAPGQAPFLQSILGPAKPALVMRTDTTNVYGKTLPSYTLSQLLDGAVEQALRLDAACVVVNLLLLPGQPELYHQSLANVAKLKADCERYGMPLRVEPLAMAPNDRAGGYMVDGDPEKIVPLVRQAVELGADVIKADPTTDLADYPRVIQAAGGKPLLVRGGGKASIEEVMQRTAEVMRLGASGIVYGRNVIQHPNPAGITRALMAIVHEEASADDALALLALGTA